MRAGNDGASESRALNSLSLVLNYSANSMLKSMPLLRAQTMNSNALKTVLREINSQTPGSDPSGPFLNLQSLV